MLDDEIKKLKEDYLEGLKHVEIIEKYKITHNELQNIIRKYKWKRTKSAAQIGNTNAKGNKGGHGAKKANKYALKTGEFEMIYKDVLNEEEKTIFKNYEVLDKEVEILKELKILAIRERRMMQRINILQDKEKGLTIESIKKKEINKKLTTETETITEVESTMSIIQKIEDGLTRIQEIKRKCLETLYKMDY